MSSRRRMRQNPYRVYALLSGKRPPTGKGFSSGAKAKGRGKPPPSLLSIVRCAACSPGAARSPHQNGDAEFSLNHPVRLNQAAGEDVEFRELGSTGGPGRADNCAARESRLPATPAGPAGRGGE